MRRIKLTREERAIEEALLKGEYRNASKAKFDEIAAALARRRKDAVISIRISRYDLDQIKRKAKRFGVKYQTFIGEVLHRVAT